VLVDLGSILSRKEAKASGSKIYRSATPCHRGHEPIRYTSNFKCLGCAKEYKKQELEHSKNRYHNDPEYAVKIKEKVKQYIVKIKEDPEKHKEMNDKKSAYAKKRRDRNPFVREKESVNYKKYRKNWNEEQKQKHRIGARNRKAMLKGADGKFTINDVRNLFAAQTGLCKACDTDLTVNGFHVDHVMPIKLGGSNSPENLQLLCAPCNLSKSAKHPDVWYHARLKGKQ